MNCIYCGCASVRVVAVLKSFLELIWGLSSADVVQFVKEKVYSA